MPNYGHLSLSCYIFERVNKGRKPPKRGMAGRETSIPKGSVSHCRSRMHRTLSHIAHKRRNVRFKGLRRVHTCLRQQDRTQRITGRNRGVSSGGGITTLRLFCVGRKPCAAGCQNGVLCRFWVLAGCTLEERRKPSEQRCAYARRCSEASRPRWAA